MSIIYEPKGRAGEYAALAINHYMGCGHRCKYCYVARMPFWQGRNFFKYAPHIKPNALERLETEALKFAGTNKRVLLCFTCDPYQPLDVKTKTTRKVIEILNRYKIPFTVCTKGGSRAMRDFDLYKPTDTFGSTLTLLDPVASRNTEPSAAIPRSRILAIETAKAAGISTWVSLEPVLDVDQTIQIIRETHEIVDLFRVGRLNYEKNNINWRQFGIRAIAALNLYKKHYYIKADLAKHLHGIRFENTDTRCVKEYENKVYTSDFRG